MGTLYLYNKDTKELFCTVENVISYTDQEIVFETQYKGETVTASRKYFGDNCEFSFEEDLSQTLRADYRKMMVTNEDRVDELEAMMVSLLYGGDSE